MCIFVTLLKGRDLGAHVNRKPSGRERTAQMTEGL